MGLHLHRAQHPPGLRPHPHRLQLRPRSRGNTEGPNLLAGTARVATGARPSDRPGSRCPGRQGRRPRFIAGTPPPSPAPGSPPTSPRAVRPEWGAPCGIARRQTSGAGSLSPSTRELAMDAGGSYRWETRLILKILMAELEGLFTPGASSCLPQRAKRQSAVGPLWRRGDSGRHKLQSYRNANKRTGQRCSKPTTFLLDRRGN